MVLVVNKKTFGVENDRLIIDVLYRYSTSSEMDIVKQKIRGITGEEIKN